MSIINHLNFNTNKGQKRKGEVLSPITYVSFMFLFTKGIGIRPPGGRSPLFTLSTRPYLHGIYGPDRQLIASAPARLYRSAYVICFPSLLFYGLVTIKKIRIMPTYQCCRLIVEKKGVVHLARSPGANPWQLRGHC